MIKQWCEAKGVTVHTGAKVEAIERDHGHVAAVQSVDTPKAEPGLLGKLAAAIGLGAAPAPAPSRHIGPGGHLPTVR